jgi:hypothetical protein
VHTRQREAVVQALASGDLSGAAILETAAGVRGLLAEVLALVRNGTMECRTANCLAVVANAQRAYFELTDIETRLSELEEAANRNGGRAHGTHCKC